MANTIVIYTCLVGGYDKLMQPLAKAEDFDFICFSNDFSVKQIGVWTIRPLPILKNLNNTRLSRFAKILPHLVLSDYVFSLYIDSNVQILTNELYGIVRNLASRDVLIAQVPHPFRDCIYNDIRISYRLRKVSLLDARRQYHHLKSSGFPKHYGLFENNIIFRKHNSKVVAEVSNAWWKEYLLYCQRDQFCLMFVYWQRGLNPEFLLGDGKNTRNVRCLKYVKHPREVKGLLRYPLFRKCYLLFHSRIRLLPAIIFIR